LPNDYYETYVSKVRSLTVEDMKGAARNLVHPNRLVWVVVGDREKIEPEIRKLGLGEIHDIDADGEPVLPPRGN
jgi:zinc protease